MIASIESEPPVAPVAVSFAEEPAFAPTIPDARPRKPEPAAPRVAPPAAGLTRPRAPAAAPMPPRGPAAEPPRPRARQAPTLRARALAWAADGAAIGALTSACIAAVVHCGRVEYPVDFLRETAALWLALLAALAFAYSCTFTALCGRTPGLLLAGLRLRSVHGGPPTAGEALARGALSLVSAGLGLFGFALALFDPRGQTLHDKLCRVLTEPDAGR